MNKTWNVLGIIGAWILSIALVLMLIVTPIVFSALSLMNADTITKAVSGALMVVGNAASQPSAETYEVTRLSEVSAPAHIQFLKYLQLSIFYLELVAILFAYL